MKQPRDPDAMEGEETYMIRTLTLSTVALYLRLYDVSSFFTDALS